MRTLLVLLVPLLLAAASDPSPLAPGSRLPDVSGELLTGEGAVLPAALHGRAALLAFGFSRGSSADCEAWGRRMAAAYGADSAVTWVELPVMGGLAGAMKGMIQGAMKKGTAAADRPHVMTVWGAADAWKRRFEVGPTKPAYLVVLDHEGRVRWRGIGPLDDVRWKEAAAALDAVR